VEKLLLDSKTNWKPINICIKEGLSMKRTRLLLLIFLLSFLTLSTLILFKANATIVKPALQMSSLDDIQVDRVDHFMRILDGGSVVINDTLQLSAKQATTLTEYPLGFPYGYSYNLANVFAFNTSTPMQTYNVSLDTGLGTNVGYYGVTVLFPQGGVQLDSGESFRFTVVFVFSDVITSSTTTLPSDPTQSGSSQNVTEPVLTVNFPLYPSLLQNASFGNVTVFLPPQTTFSDGTFLGTSGGSTETGEILKRSKSQLEKLSSTAGWINFTYPEGNPYRVITFDNLDRHLDIDGWGNILVTDKYQITSHTLQLVTGIQLHLPLGAYDVSAFDAAGAPLATPAVVNQTTSTYTVSFGFALNLGNFTRFTLTYSLPSSGYLIKTGTGDFDLNLLTSKSLDRVVGRFSFSVSIPEGASIKQYPSLSEYDLQKEALQEAISFTAYNVSLYSAYDFHVSYVYSVFWASFRPTLWMTAFVAIGLVIALLWQRPKPSVPSAIAGVAVRPQTLKSIVSSYEERTRILRELESIDRQVQRGKLPRRRYKIRKRMLESQLSRLDREMVDLKQRVKAVGPKYAGILKELDIAEAELEGVEAEEKRVEARYRSGAMPIDAYRRLQDQLSKRREKAKTTIDGALLRLSEGIA
jgi:hypothetical protein